MTPAITLWLAFVLAAGTIAWFGSKWQALAFTVLAILTAPAAFITLGHAAPWQPAKGQYKVLGARIDVDKAIYVLVDADPEPRLYKLPYSSQEASALQNAQDSAENSGGSVTVRIGGAAAEFAEDGGQNFEPQKQPEGAAIVPPVTR